MAKTLFAVGDDGKVTTFDEPAMRQAAEQDNWIARVMVALLDHDRAARTMADVDFEFVWPSDLDRAECDELERTCAMLMEVMRQRDHMQLNAIIRGGLLYVLHNHDTERLDPGYWVQVANVAREMQNESEFSESYLAELVERAYGKS